MVEKKTLTQKQPAKTERKLHVDAGAASDVASDKNSDKEADEDDDEAEEDDDEAEPQDSTDDEEPHEAVGFGDAMSKLLSQTVAEDVQPILAKRTTARMREIQSDKKEVKTARVSAAEKREREQKDMVVPDHTTAGKDRALRMIATKGVVALFNAIQKHQHASGKKEDTSDTHKVKGMSKENFLGLLQASQQQQTAATSAKSSWSVVQDDYMMDAKLKDWDNQHGTETGRVRHAGDVEVEAVEDVAWQRAADGLESDTEVAGDSTTTTRKRRTSLSWTTPTGNKKTKKTKKTTKALSSWKNTKR